MNDDRHGLGPGKYHDVLEHAAAEARASTALLIVLDGALGAGFECRVTANTVRLLPALLRDVANQIENSVRMAKTN
jgi:hypothetical protein